uniref:Uncharacterized protein n=1 Tax=Entomoneis paludosa TaxID=265537 RepID=A0A7S3DNM3_9STRA|mmetsp:Transcript_23575/g.48940  ORF Transcript_23575/g.48940 Transcript_23575/m.48940 type:complete len:194 (+) Transcript_23575:117-698(+)|eukprot:CAMPEP_0172452862 /NCGR_PEP_ID=MMETSP1065-20121228/10395_1 /TAXON_ID=265537 /ORGANISM="Amphiprora paludosa, Strain CCMP125" /LENGTH=193 /DNA_ID=CAMNT_0013204987 /DNA_START=90 /DNA_END=671 /DNA_ORIENTATION=+
MSDSNTTARSVTWKKRMIDAWSWCLLLVALFCPQPTNARCVVVSIMDQYSCNFDVMGILEAISACAYPHFCTGDDRRQRNMRSGGTPVSDKEVCTSVCSFLGHDQCAELGCLSSHDESVIRKLDDGDDSNGNHWNTTRLETIAHLKRLGLRHVRPSMCNTTKIIENFADQTNQPDIKECMYMEVEIFTNGTFH